MHFTSVIVFAVALAAAGPTTLMSSDSSDLVKRIDRTSNCGLDEYQTATEARVANIIDDLTSDCYAGDNECKTTTFTGTPGEQGKVIACIGWTGVFLSLDNSDYQFNVPFSAGSIGEQLRATYNDCYGTDPSSKAGDKGYIRAYQFWGKGYNLLITGNVDCSKHGF